MRILFSTIAKFISQGISSFADNFSLRSNTTGGLGTSTSGDAWIGVNGTINVQSGKAEATSTPSYSSGGSSYPLSTVNMSDSNVTIKLKDTNQGSTAAIWVQDSDEWWGVVSRATQTSTPGNTTYGYEYALSGYQTAWTSHSNYGFNQNSSQHTNYAYNTHSNIAYSTATASHSNYVTNYTKVAYFVYGFSASTSYSVANYTTYFGASYGTRYNSKYSLAYTKYSWSAAQANYKATTNYGYKVNSTYYAFNSSTSVSGTYSYNYTYVSGSHTNWGWITTGSWTDWFTGYWSDTYTYSYPNPTYGFQYGVTGTNATTYTVNQYLEIIQSTASAVSTISSSLVSSVATIKSILVSLVGNQITAKAYSDTNLVTQIGNDLVYTATGAVVGTQFGIAVSPSEYDQSPIIGSSVEIDVV